MESTVANTQAQTGTAPLQAGVAMQQVPLSFLKDGESARVIKVRGRGDLHHHLENIGFVEGANIKVISGANGNLIVQVKGAQVAIGKDAAMKIVTSACA